MLSKTLTEEIFGEKKYLYQRQSHENVIKMLMEDPKDSVMEVKSKDTIS